MIYHIWHRTVGTILGHIFGWNRMSAEHWERFMEPQIERARHAGIPDSRIGELLQQALDDSDFQVIYPSTRLRDLIDTEIA